MCLHETKGVPEKTEGFGWKVFEQSRPGAQLYSVYFGTTPYARRKWVSAISTGAKQRGWAGSPARYQTGFHLHVNREDAVRYLDRKMTGGGQKRFVLRKVRYRGAFLHGNGDGTGMDGWRILVIVAAEMYIIEANRA